MDCNDLTKAQARQLITPIVDNEASAEEHKAFMDFIAHHEDVKREYESIKRVKSLVCNRCPCAKAPESLRHFLSSVNTSQSPEESAPPIYDIPSQDSVSQHPKNDTPASKNNNSNSLFYAAASILIITIVLWAFNFGGFSSENLTYNVEEYAYQHFMNNDGKLVPPTIATASLGMAENRMEQDYDMAITIPELKNAEFKGVVYDEFIPDYKAPMMEYYLPSEDQYIYIFAFDIDKMQKFGQLVRDQEAIKQCTKAKDFHIREVNEKHVVSWKWNGVWYAAISNHDGNTIASLVEPLDFNPSED